MNQAMTIVLSVHLTAISFTRGMVERIWVFVKEIVIKMMIAPQASPVSSGADSTPCLDAKVRGHVAKTTAFRNKVTLSPTKQEH